MTPTLALLLKTTASDLDEKAALSFRPTPVSPSAPFQVVVDVMRAIATLLQV
jgi:hypothetical protein